MMIFVKHSQLKNQENSIIIIFAKLFRLKFQVDLITVISVKHFQ